MVLGVLRLERLFWMMMLDVLSFEVGEEKIMAITHHRERTKFLKHQTCLAMQDVPIPDRTEGNLKKKRTPKP